MIDGLEIPEEYLLLWKEKERAWIQSSSTGCFETMEAAEAEYNQAAHFVMSKAHTATMDQKINDGVTH